MDEPELLFYERFLPDSQELFTTLVKTVEWDLRMKSRKTASFGTAYDYSGITYQSVPMHPLLVPVVDCLEARLEFQPNNCLLNFYESGEATMGFHSDSTQELVEGTGIAIVSLGAARDITFQYKRSNREEFTYRLISGSLLYMSAEIQQNWRHAIRKQPGAGARISLTFRCVATVNRETNTKKP